MKPLKGLIIINKSQRLNDMMRFMNDIHQFNLQHLMDRYSISKSTALRDIQDLEELGMPIYIERGRYGQYNVLQNNLLAPVYFTFEEVSALYFAMNTLESYQSTPFHIQLEVLQKKFAHCLSTEQLKELTTMAQSLQFESRPHAHSSPLLKDIVQIVTKKQNCDVHYANNKSYAMQFFQVKAQHGQWYVAGIDLHTQRHRVLRCDRITSLNILKTPILFYEKDFQTLIHTKKKNQFEVTIKEHAVDLFYKEQYPSLTLQTNPSPKIIGSYDEQEENFIADYFIRFSESIVSISPPEFQEVIKKRLDDLTNHFSHPS